MAERTVPGEVLTAGTSSTANSRPASGNRIFLIQTSRPNTKDWIETACWRVPIKEEHEAGGKVAEEAGAKKKRNSS